VTVWHESDLRVVHDGAETCPYLPNRTARMPLRAPEVTLTGAQFDELLALGFRRYGPLVYRTQCANCQACEAIRIPVDHFRPRRTLARTFREGNERFSATIGPSQVDVERVALFNKHRDERELNRRGATFSASDYEFWFVDSCVKTVEIAYRQEDRLIGVAICDLGAQSMSAVYTYFDPDLERFSPGSYSVLYQWQLCQQWQLDYLYLGFFVAGSPHMQYKARFKPHERLVKGRWRRDQDADVASKTEPSAS
jgi:leucyl-tRNA---protein transferase